MIFKCVYDYSYRCCNFCERREKCKDPCLNRPERCAKCFMPPGMERP